MLKAQQIFMHRDLIVIDPWPEPLLYDQYQRLAAWMRCVHARPLGIHQLVGQGYDIQVDLDMVWYRQGGFDLWSSPDSLDDDAYQWRQITERQCLLKSTEENRQIADLHLSQQP